MGLTVIVIVADDQLFELAVLAQLTPYVLVEGVEVVLQLAGVHLALGVVGRVLVHVGHEDGLGVGWLNMLSGAAVAVSACANLVVEGAVDLVLLGTEDGSEVVGHGECLSEMLVDQLVRDADEGREREVVRAGEAKETTGEELARSGRLLGDIGCLKFLESSSGALTKPGELPAYTEQLSSDV